MYCPKCATPVDGMKFCRQCGTNVALVQQALTGQLAAPTQPTVPIATQPQAPEQDWVDHWHEHWGDWSGKRKRRDRNIAAQPTISHAMHQCIVGVGFLAAAIMVTRFFPSGVFWGWTFLFPAFGALGDGVAEYWRVRELEQAAQPQAFGQANQAVPAAHPQPQPQMQVPTTSELQLPEAAASPVSITEHTTALLDKQAARPLERV